MVHRSARLFGELLSTKISSSLVTNTLYGLARLAGMINVGLELPLNQTMVWPVSRFSETSVLLVVMKMPRGDEPMMLLATKVVAFGFQEALGQNFG